MHNDQALVSMQIYIVYIVLCLSKLACMSAGEIFSTFKPTNAHLNRGFQLVCPKVTKPLIYYQMLPHIYIYICVYVILPLIWIVYYAFLLIITLEFSHLPIAVLLAFSVGFTIKFHAFIGFVGNTNAAWNNSAFYAHI